VSAHIPEGSVVITPTEMYAEMRAIHDSVNSIKDTLDPAVAEIRTDLADHEARIRGMEKRIWLASGAFALISVGSSLLPYLKIT